MSSSPSELNFPDFWSVKSVFDCFNVGVAEDVPGEVADFFDGDVELAFLEGFSDFLDWFFGFAQYPFVQWLQVNSALVFAGCSLSKVCL